MIKPLVTVALAAVILAASTGSLAIAAFPADPPNDPGYAPAEQGGVETCATESADTQQHYLFSFIPRCAVNATDPEGAAGMSLDEAWRDYTTGDAGTVIAYIEGGINWHDQPRELANQVFLNAGELPEPTTPVGDGRLNAEDFADTPDHNANGVVDPEDIIVRFEDGADDDSNGYPDDISGWDFYNDQNNPATIDSEYGHANRQMEQAAADTDNGIGDAGVCPDCMIVPIKAGAEALDRTDDLAEAWNYAADIDVDVVVSVTADLGFSSFMRDTVERLWDKGIVMVEASNDFNSTDHQGGQFWPHVLPGNGMVSNVHGLSTAPGTAAAENGLLTSFRARSGFTSWGTHNMFSASTKGGTTSEATPTIGGVIAIVLAWGKEAAAKGMIERPLTGPETIQVVRATASDVSGDTNWPSQPGFDLQFGYGRPEVPDAMAAIAAGDIPPVTWFDGPRWYSLYDPTRTSEVPIKGFIDAPRQAGAFTWELQYALGAEPTDDQFRRISSGKSSKPVDGRLGRLDLGLIPESFWAAPFGISKRKELETSEQYTVTLRVQVTDGAGRIGEERRSIAVHHDPAWPKAFPKRIGSSGEGQPQLADLQGRGRLAMIFGDSDGRVHAIDGKTGKQLSGFPVRSNPTVVRRGHRGVDPGREPFITSVAVADLGRRGRLSVIATSTSGRVYVWNSAGRLRKGWPKQLGFGLSKPPNPRPELPYTRAPALGATSPPVVEDLDGDGQFDVIQAAWDGRIHAWSERGRVLDGYPFKVELGDDHETPVGYVTINDQKLDTPPAIADLDGDGSPELVIRSQFTHALGTGLQPAPYSHLHAYHADGTPVEGWPIDVLGLVSFAGSAQEFITEGAAAPVAADVDGDGDDEIAWAPALFSPTQLFDGDGSSIRTFAPVPGATLSLLQNDPDSLLQALDGNLPDDTPVNFTNSGAFGRVGGDSGVSYAEPGVGVASVAGGLVLTGSGIPINSYMRVFDAGSGANRRGFPARLQGLDFLGNPAIADVTGDGEAEVINGGDSSAIHAYGNGGAQAGGFPHFQPGWILWGPSVGDIDSDGNSEVVAMTREGYLMAWRTEGDADEGNQEWWSYRHDERNTGRYGTDTRPPGQPQKAKVAAARLRFELPGDDWFAGRADHFRVWFVDRRNKRIGSSGAKRPISAAAGARVSVELPRGTRKVKIRVFDEADNGSRRVRWFVR